MKVALVSDCYLPRLGGIEVQVHDLAQRLAAEGHEVEAFTVTPAHAEQYSGTEVIDGITVHRFALGLPHDVAVNPMAISQMRVALTGGGFDVVHAHIGVISLFSMDVVRMSLGMGLPTAVTWHSVMSWAGPLLSPLGFVRRWSQGGAALSAVSEVAARPIRRMAGRDSDIVVLPNGIDTAVWHPGHREGDGSVRVISAMRLAARKRPLDLFKVMKAVHREAPNVRLEIAGEGDLRSRLVRAVDLADAHEWVSLPGRMTRAQLRERYWASDIYVAPARLEAFGIAALEARSCGLPIVAPDTSGVSEFIEDGVNGLLVHGDDGLVAGLTRLVLDADLRASMAQTNRTEPPAQAWTRVVHMAEAEYERAAFLMAARG